MDMNQNVVTFGCNKLWCGYVSAVARRRTEHLFVVSNFLRSYRAEAAVCRRQKIGLFQLEAAAAAAAAGPELIQQLLLLLLSRQTVETFIESCVCRLCYEKCFMEK